ncbi:unnamed protein product [Musa hybrid cultivar]
MLIENGSLLMDNILHSILLYRTISYQVIPHISISLGHLETRPEPQTSFTPLYSVLFDGLVRQALSKYLFLGFDADPSFDIAACI